MSKLTLNSVQLRNFGSVRQSEVQFPKQGFVLVTGLNKTGAGRFESIGSGKTLLGEAISRALFNVPGRFKRIGGYSTNDAGNTYIKVEATIENQPLVVELGYKCKELSRTGEGLRYTVGNQTPVSFGNVQDTREELAKIVGMPPEVAAWTVHLDGDKLDFNALSESSAVNLLMGTLDQPPWTEYQRKAAKVADRFKTSATSASAQHELTKTSLAQAKVNLEQAEANLAHHKEAYEREQQEAAARSKIRAAKIAELQALFVTGEIELAKLKKEISEAESKEAAAYHERELMVQRRTSALSQAMTTQMQAQKEVGTAEKSLEKLRTAKQVAISTYTKQAYLEANAVRTKALLETRLAEQANAKSIQDWNTAEFKLTRAISEAEVEYRGAEITLNEALKAYDKELNVPCKCPLPGCGKPWPRTNQVALATAAERLNQANLAKVCAEEQIAKAKQTHLEFTGTQPHQLSVPTIPEEQPVPPFPDEALWETKFADGGKLLSEAKLRLECQVKIVAEEALQLKEAQTALSSLKLASKVPQLSATYEQVEKRTKTISFELSSLNQEEKTDVVDATPVKLAQVKVTERTEACQKYQAKLDQTAQELVECQEAFKAADYWVDAYGPTGIPNMIIKEAVTPLNSVSQKVSLRMTGGLIEVNYSTSRQLASGRERNELMITSTNKYGSAQVAGSSKGESGLLNIIVAETLAEVGNVASRVGFQWMDEIASGQDQLVRRSIFSYLRERAKDLGILIFVVDHATEVSSYADSVLVAEKDSSGTTYHWQ